MSRSFHACCRTLFKCSTTPGGQDSACPSARDDESLLSGEDEDDGLTLWRTRSLWLTLAYSLAALRAQTSTHHQAIRAWQRPKAGERQLDERVEQRASTARGAASSVLVTEFFK